MWIAKPIQSLSSSEKEAWLMIERKSPLAQSLSWARAIEAVGGRSYVVFSPEEGVGGMVYSSTSPTHSSRTTLECINGPNLDWDNPNCIARQFATFAMASAQLSQNFDSLRIQPRWNAEDTLFRLKHLPIPPSHQNQAATLVIPIQSSKDEQFSRLSSRLKRTLSSSWRNQVKTEWKKLTPDLLKEFVPSMTQFGQAHGFTVPPLCWFEALIDSPAPHLTFWIASARIEPSPNLYGMTQALVCIQGTKAYYLFGYDQRSEGLKASISTSAAAHWEALLRCAQFQVTSYDLNGYLIDAQPNHPYYGVCKFKEQFAGNLVQYESPEFIIT
jgi:hypothetical protein